MANLQIAEGTMTNTRTPTPATRDLVLTRELNAPRRLVFDAWTQADKFSRWFSPTDFTNTNCTIDLRVGGIAHFCHNAPDGRAVWCRFEFVEIAPPGRLVFNESFADARGNYADPAVYGIPHARTVVRTEVTFEDLGRKTLMTIRAIGLPANDFADQAEHGWNQTFDKLEDLLAANPTA